MDQSNTDQSNQPGQPVQVPFDPGAPHQNRPKLRAVRGFPMQAQGPDGQSMPMIGLADARQISDKVVVTAPAAQVVLPLLDGTRGIDEIVSQVGRGLTRQILEGLIAQLDDAALLEGPKYDALVAEMRRQFDSSPTLPPAASAAFADAIVMQDTNGQATEEQRAEEGPKRVRETFDQWMAKALEQAENPSFDELPKAIVAPHVDYWRGWTNYGAIYGRLRVCDRPDRVIVLGTNHFGMGTGVVGCDKGYQTPLGVCNADVAVVDALRGALGDGLFEHRYDHEREHSIELQMMWIQHVFGQDEHGNYPTVFGALIHDPAVNNGQSYDGKGIALDAFVGALKQAISDLPGRTLVVSSADLSHIGQAFGDQQVLVGDGPEVVEARERVVKHDMSMLELVTKRAPGELVSAMAWQQNPTRWCSTGNIVAALMTVEPSEVELLNYTAAVDQQGTALVSSAALVMR